jgi:hypothetical protein
VPPPFALLANHFASMMLKHSAILSSVAQVPLLLAALLEALAAAISGANPSHDINTEKSYDYTLGPHLRRAPTLGTLIE